MDLKSSKQYERILYDLKNKIVCSCGFNGKPYKSKDSLIRICPDCKKKFSPTNGTIFHNVRFGLVKAFMILKKDIEKNYTSTSSEVAKEFKITQKTAWYFLKKIRNNKQEAKTIISHYEDPNKKTNQCKPTKDLDNELKLIIAYVNQMLKNNIKLDEIAERLVEEGVNNETIKYVLNKFR